MKIHCYLCGCTEVSDKLYCAEGLVVKLCCKCEEDRAWREKVRQRCQGIITPKRVTKRVVIPQ